jgi:hypothetical protein
VGTEIAEEEPEPCARGHLQAAREFRSEAPSIGQLYPGSDQANGVEKCKHTNRAKSQRLHIIVTTPLCLASHSALQSFELDGDILCVVCPSQMGGGYHPPSKKVLLCQNHIEGAAMLGKTLAHELIHVCEPGDS